MGICNSTKKTNSPRARPVVNTNINTLNVEDKTILQLKLCRDNIKGYIRKLEQSESRAKQKAKDELKKKDRNKAKMLLSRSKLYKEQRDIAQGQLNMIEDQAMAIETAKNQREAVQVLQQGNEILKKLNDEVNVEKWEAIADDMRDLKVQQDEIATFLKNHNIPEEQYEEQLNKELEMLAKSVGGDVIDLPDAVRGTPKVVIKEEPKVVSPKKEEEVREAVAI
jgi:charged multivesicular body protein 6